MKITGKPNTDEILKAVKDNARFCPCKTTKSDDTKCPCKDFKEQSSVGECHCGLYKIMEENI